MSKSWSQMDNEEKIRVIVANFGDDIMGGLGEISPEDEEVVEVAQQILELFT